MASIIRVKRSTGTSAPSSLQFGEVGVTLSGGGTQGNSGDRLFVGDNGGNPQVVGGRYFTDLLNNTPGSVASAANASTASNGFVAIVDQNRKVDQWNVDNLRLDSNVLSTTNTDGDLFLSPNFIALYISICIFSNKLIFYSLSIRFIAINNLS